MQQLRREDEDHRPWQTVARNIYMKLLQYIDISSQQHCVQSLVVHTLLESINRLLSFNTSIKILTNKYIIYYFIFIHYNV